jgi:hypothetical protein
VVRDIARQLDVTLIDMYKLSRQMAALVIGQLKATDLELEKYLR